MNNFIDTAEIEVISGRGGDGVVAWRREKFEPMGGPAGGDGGNGASVFLQATRDLNTLLDFKFKKNFVGEHGQNGGSARKSGITYPLLMTRS